jgi:hypothetical protein
MLSENNSATVTQTIAETDAYFDDPALSDASESVGGSEPREHQTDSDFEQTRPGIEQGSGASVTQVAQTAPVRCFEAAFDDQLPLTPINQTPDHPRRFWVASECSVRDCSSSQRLSARDDDSPCRVATLLHEDPGADFETAFDSRR